MMKTIFFPPLIGSFAVILTSYSFSAEQHAHNRQLLLLVSSLPTVLHQILFLFLKQLTSQLLFFLLFPLQITNKESRSSSTYIYILKIQIQTSFLGIQTGKVASNKVLPADPPVNFHGILILISLGTENPASSSPTWTMWAEEKRKTIKILSQKPDKNSHFLLSFLCCACIQSL